MRMRHGHRLTKGRGHRRGGAAVVELSLVLPLLSFIMVASTDFARLFHDYIIITDSARNGALYAGQNSTLSAAAYQAGVTAAALADAGAIKPAPGVSIASGSLGVGNNYVEVTVSSVFTTLSMYPGIPSSVALQRTVRVRIPPASYRTQ